jgi:hypothetical protein
MAVMARKTWTDERLDDLKEGVASLDRRIEMGFRELRQETAELRAEMLSLHRTTMQIVIGGFAMTFVGFGGTIATILATH